MKNSTAKRLTFALVLSIAIFGCGSDSKEGKSTLNRDEIKSESIQEALDRLEQVSDDEALPEDVQKEVKTEVDQIKKDKIEKFQQAITASPYKALNDNEIQEMLEKRLEEYKSNCSGDLYSKIRKEMNDDEVLIQYSSKNRQYIKTFAGRLQAAHKTCSN